MTRLVSVVGALALAAASGLCGCSDDESSPPRPRPDGDGPGDACTAIGCDDGLTIQFSVSEPGAYLFNIVADGATISCSATLPFPDCSSPGSTCGDPRVQLAASGCALAPAEHSLEGLFMSGMVPESVSVLATRDGVEIASQTFTPAYQTTAPNGEECGPICTNASVSLPTGDAP